MLFSHKKRSRLDSGVVFAPGVSKFQIMAFRCEQNIVCLDAGFYTMDHVPDEHLPQITTSSSHDCVSPSQRLVVLGFFICLFVCRGFLCLFVFLGIGMLISLIFSF